MQHNWQIFATTLLIVLLVGFGCSDSNPPLADHKTQSEPAPFGPPLPPDFELERYETQLPARSSLRDVLTPHQFSAQDIHQLLTDTNEVFDLNRVTAGNRLALAHYSDGRFHSLEYDISPEEYLVVRYDQGRFRAEKKQRNLTAEVSELYGRIKGSLWQTLELMGESGLLTMRIVDLLQWDIAFPAIQPDDWFKVIVEKLYNGDEFVKYGMILAIEFNHQGTSYYAFAFEDPASGKTKYYNREGESVRRAFLKVPFKYDYRISSGFSYNRLHPVHKVRRPHLGIDYAAPRGTPVLASGSGQVVFAGWKGANGKLVKIRHPSGYTTYYLHLSKIYVRRGQHVSQGQRIGAVGATGTVTAAHLDYRIQDKRGKFHNPARLVFPPEAGVPEAHMKEFLAIRDSLFQQLQRIDLNSDIADRYVTAGG